MIGEIHEECGIFGIYDNDGLDAARTTYYALYALQHRGQESCGIAVNDNRTVVFHKGVGLVPDVFNEVILNHLKGQMAIGHCRYSTTGNSTIENAQPLVSKYIKGTLALAHNGNLINSQQLRRELELNGAIFQTTNDSEVIAYILAKERLRSSSIEEAVQRSMGVLKGAYSIVLMSPEKLIAARDPYGFRPLSIGKIKNSYVIASETCAFDAIGAEFVRDIDPGEIVVIGKQGISSIRTNCTGRPNLCIFEFVYFARPDSVLEGASVYLARQEAGRYLAKEHPVEADVVIGVPDSGLDAALGYSKESGIPYGVGFIKNRYVGRTFIQSTQDQRDIAVKIKLNVLKAAVEGKRVILVDDSIVRGTTSKRIVSDLRAAGATEVHMRISSPPFLNPCYFGTDIDSKDKLIACKMSIEEIAKELGADSLGYLSIDNLRKIPVGANCDFCDGCFTGKYPMDVSWVDDYSKDMLEKSKE